MLMTSSTTDTSQPPQVEYDAISDRTAVQRHVGVVGLGQMGMAFAANFVADGHRVLVWDRNPEHVAARRPAGADGAQRLEDLADCDVIVSSVTDDNALRSVVLGAE